MSLLTLPAWTKDGNVHVIVETPRGSRSKITYDTDLHVFTLESRSSSG